ncbi:MAG: hypothetical protein GC162_09240 [Planctomycetes bacterium]|nr:hypothetical protein [Planctomycetota bacterium]
MTNENQLPGQSKRLLPIAALIVTAACRFAAAELVADYQFNDVLTSSDPQTAWTTSSFASASGSFTPAFIAAGNPGKSIETDGSETQNSVATSISTSRYYTFSVTPAADHVIVYNSISWDARALASGTGAMNTNTAAFWSTDAFANEIGAQEFTEIAPDNSTSAWGTHTVSLGGTVVESGATTFRLAVWDNSTSPNKRNQIDNVRVQASVYAYQHLTPTSIDNIRGEGQSNAPTGYYANGGRNVVGVQGSTATNTRQNENLVLGFTLPTNIGGEIYKATLSLAKLDQRFDSGVFNLDLYGLLTSNPDVTGTSFFLEANTDGNVNVDKLADNYITSGQANGSTSTVDVTAFIKALYSGNNPTQTEAFFRLNPDRNLAFTSAIDRILVDLASADLAIVVIPTPAALPGGLLMFTLLMVRRRK